MESRQSFHQGLNAGLIFGGLIGTASGGAALVLVLVSVAVYLYRDTNGWK